MDSLRDMSISDLLDLHMDAIKELRRRDVLRSENTPTGDFAEYLFCGAFGWKRADNAAKAFDAKGNDDTRYQIKARRLHRRNKARQLSPIRDLDGFDTLAAVLFDDTYRVTRAALIPNGVVRQRSTFIPYVNGYRFLLQDEVWDVRGVCDVTDRLHEFMLSRCS